MADKHYIDSLIWCPDHDQHRHSLLCQLTCGESEYCSVSLNYEYSLLFHLRKLALNRIGDQLVFPSV